MASGQVFERADIPFTVNGNPLPNALTGGLNNPQPSEVDLNNDGVQDLYVFDRNGNVHLTFLNEGSSGAPDWHFAPEYARNFPDCRDWVLLRDYDQDGAMDIFTHYSGAFKGMRVFKGGYNADNELTFTTFQFFNNPFNAVYYEQINGNLTNLNITQIDYPVVDDINGDGDLDVLTFSIAGSYVEYYENRSLEFGWGLDSINFKKIDVCWGGFYESSFSQVVTLSDTPGECADGLTGGGLQERHAGSTLVTFDANADGVKEILLGDLIYPNFTYLINGGTEDDAYMVDQDPTFPSYDVPVEIHEFPAPFYLDLDADGLRDLAAAPNNIGSTPNYEVFWFYKNIGTADFPEFELQQKDFLVETMLDYGTGTNPTFFDYNADGLMDLLIGTEGYFVSGGNRDPRLVLFENIGTASEPAFEEVDNDYLTMSQYAEFTWFFAPTFGDMDNDGDQDLLIGDAFGALFFVENTAGPANPVAWGPIQPEWKGIDVGQNSRPFIVDLDRDGLADMVLGERNGNVNYFRNIGTPDNPDFDSDPDAAVNNSFLGQVNTLMPMDPSSGNSAPLVLDYGDAFLFLTGSEVGPILLYADIEGNISEGAFTQVNMNFGETKEGERTSLAAADLDNDGLLELAVGNSRGGLSIFETDLDAADLVSVDQWYQEVEVRVFPNPVQEQLRISISAPLSMDFSYRIFDVLGRKVQEGEKLYFDQQFSVATLPSGAYFLQVEAGNRSFSTKFIKD